MPKKQYGKWTQSGDIIHVRLPVGWKEKFKKRCKKDLTNMNREIVMFIKSYIE